MPYNIKDFGDEILLKATSRFDKRLAKIQKTQKLIKAGRGILANSEKRLRKFYNRERVLLEEENSISSDKKRGAIEIPEIGLERKIGKTDNKLSIEFFEKGLLAAGSVGRLRILDKDGTGFHVGHQIVITNYHVLGEKDLNVANSCEFELNVEANKIGKPKRIISYGLDPNRFVLFNEELDFTLVSLTKPLRGDPNIDEFGWHALLADEVTIRLSDSVNIIQHPNGGEKSVVVHDSNFLDLEDNTDLKQFCWYTGDTETGSSGSPVFNNHWEIVALHHKAIPKTDKNDNILDLNGNLISKERAKSNPKDVAWKANEGILISAIVKAVKAAKFKIQDHEKIRDELLELWASPSAHKRGLKAAEERILKLN